VVKDIIEEIYRTGVVRDGLGNEHELHSAIDVHEGEFISQLVSSDPDIRKTLEIGCAYGLSSLYICSALYGRDSVKHTIVDPNQNSGWHGIGVSNLERAGFDFFELIEKPSEFVLPDIAQNKSGAFDMVFIDGWHTFDHTLLDLFYANRLIRVGGYIVIDDCNWPSIAKAVSYFLMYPAYRLEKRISRTTARGRLADIVTAVIPPSIAGYIFPRNIYDKHYLRALYSSIVALKKVANDERSWDWFESF